MIDGRAWMAEHYPERVEAVAAFLAMVTEENGRQNLVSPSTLAHIWERHALDSAQLLRFDRPDGLWMDVGTGGGFPGMVIAILRDQPVMLVEPRARRAGFLEEAAVKLGLHHVSVVPTKVERVSGSMAAVVSARAVANIPALLAATSACTNRQSRWILPRGRSGRDELAALQHSFKGVFHVEQSIVDPESAIVILDKVQAR